MFRADEELPGARGVIISHALWRQRFGADPHVVGREILIDSQPRDIVGVMPATFAFPSVDTQVWIPFAFDRSAAAALWGGAQGGYALARLAPGATAARAQAEMRAQRPELRKANTLWVFPNAWGERREVVSLQDEIVGDVRTRLLVMLGAVGFVLLIACANVANLLLARASARQREIAIRYALGASRGRIIRQLLTESAVLGLIGGSAGFLLAYWGVPLLVSSLPADMPRVEEIGVDRWMLAFTLGVSVLTGVAFGLVPAIQASRSTVQTSLKIEERGATAPLGRASSLLVIGEVAVAVLLVIVAGLLIRSFTGLLRVDPGFRTERIVTARVTPPADPLSHAESARVFYDSLLARVAALPGVQSVEAVSHLPLASRMGGFAFEVEGMPYVRAEGAPTTGERNVTPGYLRAMGIPLLKGRLLTEEDREKTPAVALINETMARQHFARRRSARPPIQASLGEELDHRRWRRRRRQAHGPRGRGRTGSVSRVRAGAGARHVIGDSHGRTMPRRSPRACARPWRKWMRPCRSAMSAPSIRSSRARSPRGASRCSCTARSRSSR